MWVKIILCWIIGRFIHFKSILTNPQNIGELKNNKENANIWFYILLKKEIFSYLEKKVIKLLVQGAYTTLCFDGVHWYLPHFNCVQHSNWNLHFMCSRSMKYCTYFIVSDSCYCKTCLRLLLQTSHLPNQYLSSHWAI